MVITFDIENWTKLYVDDRATEVELEIMTGANGFGAYHSASTGQGRAIMSV